MADGDGHGSGAGRASFVTEDRTSKICAVCGRTIEWRKKWARDWANVRYCSDACRRRKRGTKDEALEAAILALLRGRARGATICPSEAAKAVLGADGPWRSSMEAARSAARRLVARGEVEVTQKGRTVDPSRAKGPIRIRKTES